jgi:hypothetical protein
LIGGFGPAERPALLIVLIEVLADCRFQLFGTSEGRPSQTFFGQQCKPALDLIDP